MRVLLVEDEVSLSAALAKLLKKNKIEVDVANDGASGKQMADRDIYDVIVLDIMLPEVDGLTVLKHIRQTGKKVPVLLLTAKDSTQDKVKGLNMGADDYVVKPFETDELIARIRALGRRAGEQYADNVIQYADLVLDTTSGELSIGTKKVRLTAKESQMLELFILNPEQTIAKKALLERIWGNDGKAAENSVEIYVHYLRKKLSGAKVTIKTLRGMGYVLKRDE
ncbi:response regulator receiver domain protein [Pseudoramibacter alactolyticus ATCC 23263]|uniref:Stage 0 sporulation protein A homolog n=1 Tax=Pseudoramibacter alactolyticus ATCC 23263 TaxID=887929 RepID=E6MET6_9FIRM|nr:response regulator transcription factor [Pseudoramibacter alactolyticus]EFV02374.1 response regulator receiver domain protein [Pseudoramibacter alactolyticus ATCC 23263]